MKNKISMANPTPSRTSTRDQAIDISKQNVSKKKIFQRQFPVATFTLSIWSFLQSVCYGIFQIKRMVRKEDWTKIMFVYLCLFHVAPGQLCGPSPLAGLERMAEVLGKDLGQLLETLRTQNYLAYQRLEDHWRDYMDCIAMVDTGYFK